MLEISQLKRIIEAALLASAQPLTLPQISGLFDEFAMPEQDDLAKAVAELQADAAERGVELVEVASGFRYQIRHDVHPFVSKLWTERQTRYSRALLETLALIAYRQPITRAEIEQIRGVAVSTNIIRTLEERDWVRVVGYRDLPGKPALFGTTKQFLDYFNLKSLDQLPALSEIRDFEEVDPQLALDGSDAAIPARIEVEETDGETDEAEDAATEGESAVETELGQEVEQEVEPQEEAGRETEAAAAEESAEQAMEVEHEAAAHEAAAEAEESELADAASAAEESGSEPPRPEPSGAERADTETTAVEEDAESTTTRAEPSAGATSGKTTEPAA